MTQITGVISLVYGILLNTGISSRNHSPPKPASNHTLSLSLQSLRLLNHFACVDLHMLQAILGSEGLSLQLRHIASYLLWYCSHWNNTALLHELILLIGYFTVLNVDNQNVMQSGRDPQQATILQQLCSLPFDYFSNPKLTRVLFPTLISCCFRNDENKAVLQQEMSAVMLSSFIEV
ncbi:S phase cyclin A-associated protein in the endoplasmic reticulum-like protein [Leptotrombidium deliense]|uniref:S phase cyclin A-associated protein in the endoplasmic reticulum-like protein n=1 Tax=Leptotrombidium deliense TaxID=299467 RepID=A0A443SRA9_9ACAR|nr:S phase cyclin A-associated protein in the endoplasmic reticulum-like protein [Leptotrombidium deliense]